MKKEVVPIVEVLGSSPTNKVLDFLMDNKDEGFSLTEIRDRAKVRYSTLQLLIPKILERELIRVKKRTGIISFYQINISNPFVQSLMFSREVGA